MHLQHAHWTLYDKTLVTIIGGGGSFETSAKLLLRWLLQRSLPWEWFEPTHTWLDPEMWPPKINCTVQFVHPILFPVTDLVVVVKWVVSKWGNSVHLTVCARCSHHQWGFIHFETLCQIHKKTFNQQSASLRWQNMICEHTEAPKLTLFLEDEDEGEDDGNEDGSGHDQHWIEHMAPESVGWKGKIFWDWREARHVNIMIWDVFTFIVIPIILSWTQCDSPVMLKLPFSSRSWICSLWGSTHYESISWWWKWWWRWNYSWMSNMSPMPRVTKVVASHWKKECILLVKFLSEFRPRCIHDVSWFFHSQLYLFHSNVPQSKLHVKSLVLGKFELNWQFGICRVPVLWLLVLLSTLRIFVTATRQEQCYEILTTHY